LETGALITRLTSDVNQIQDTVFMMMRGMVRMPLLIIGSVVLAAFTSPRLSWIFLIMVPVLACSLIFIIRRTFPLYRQVQQRLDGLNNVLQENLAGVRVVKAFARRLHEAARFSRANQSLSAASLEAVRMGARSTPVMTFTLNLGIVAALWIGGRQVFLGSTQVGEVVAFINYLMQATHALVLFSNMIVQLSRAQASARRVGELLASQPAIKPAPAAETPLTDAHGKPGRIVFESVSFRYGATGDLVLRNISFTAEPGQTVALLGATGSGKSSLVQLIPRFHDVTAGHVTIDGVDVREIPEDQLHARVGIALQESILFSDTLRQNIAMGAPDASLEEIKTAARLAQADDFISHLPEGYETPVGQRGVNLSGGQKQRIAIARALLPRPGVLILDDSTSAVDVRTETLIQNALQTHAHARTLILVAQRISSVRTADKILVLDDGEIVDQGTHAELLESSPIYREIHASQTETSLVLSSGD
ncbi:MAG: ABC transporter ATP-binding protein, partial [Rariglobus sp.]